MMHLKESPTLFQRVSVFIKPHLPSKKDNFLQSALKVLFILVLVAAIVFTSIFLNYFSHGKIQQSIIAETQELWNNANNNGDTGIYKTLKNQNTDFKAWLKVGSGVIALPVYQTDNNRYYKTHNQKKQSSRYGALFFDKDCNLDNITRNFNVLIYGNNMLDGSMFGKLENYRKIDFFKQHNTITLSFPNQEVNYKVFAAFVYSDKNAFDILTQYVETTEELSYWANEVKKLSFINTDVDIKSGDTFLSLITDSDEFEGAKNVVVARKIRDNETSYTDTSNFTVNSNRELPNK